MNANEELLKRIDDLLVVRLEPVNQRLGVIEKRQDSLEKGQKSLQDGQKGLIQKQESFEKEQKKQGKKLDYVKDTLDVAIKIFDRGYVELRKRVQRLESM